MTAEPFIKKIELRKIHKYIVVASDGVWDVIKDTVTILFIGNRSIAGTIDQLQGSLLIPIKTIRKQKLSGQHQYNLP